jgi:FkbM family methyltransferase
MTLHLGTIAERLRIPRDSRAYLWARDTYWGYRARRGVRSWSQFGEDISLRRILAGEKGTYVDVGAGHPIIGSNTYALWREGWRGTLIDPLPSNAAALRHVRRGDIVLEAACRDSTEPLELFEYETYQLSTASGKVVIDLASRGIHPIRTRRVESVRLGDLPVTAKPRDAALLSIDVEGAELDVLRGNDWAKYLPGVLCVEMWIAPWLDRSEMLTYLQDLGYELVEYLGVSAIFTHVDRA